MHHSSFSEKCRVPAWCDRILWTGNRIQTPTIYKSVPQLRISDHKPVIAHFSVKVPVLHVHLFRRVSPKQYWIFQVKRIDEKKYARVYESVLREADRLENEWLPTVVIDKAEFTFQDVKYLEPQVQTLTVKNTGQVRLWIPFTKTEMVEMADFFLGARPNQFHSETKR